MSGFIFESVAELTLFVFPPLVLTVATVWIIWHVLEKIDGIIDTRSFLAFILVIIPLVMLIYGGLAIVIHNEFLTASGGLAYLPWAPTPRVNVILAGAVIYIGLTAWLWWYWRELRIPR
jgi:hypothetical protein